MMSGNGMYGQNGAYAGGGNYGAPNVMGPSGAQIGGGFGAIGAGLGQLFFGDGPNPYDKMNDFYKQIPGKTAPYYQPYMDTGKQALSQLHDQFGNLINDPNATMSKIGGGFQQSPGYDWQLKQGMNAANNAAAAGGMLGTPQHQQQAATMAEGLANQDYYNYLNHALGLYGTGLNGMNGLNTMGFNSNEQMANIIANSLANQGNIAFSGQAAENQNRGQMWGNIFGGAAQLAPFLIG